MNNTKLESISELLRKYQFSSVDTSVDLVCIICKNMLIDAVVSNVCGCQYCYECITKYLISADNYCPGEKEDCKDERITLEKNAFRSTLLNKKIGKLKFNCPFELCDCIVELNEMDCHLKVCPKLLMECPYAAIGCSNQVSIKDAIITHLQCDTLSHTELLLELIYNMKNEVNIIKDYFVQSKLETVSLNEELIATRKAIETRDIKEWKSMKKEIDDQRIEIESLKKQMINNSESEKTRNENINRELRKKKIGISSVEEELIRLNRKLKEDLNNIDKEINKQKRRIENVMIERDDERQAMNDLRLNINNIKIGMKTNNEKLERKITYWIKWNQLCPNIDGDFMWKFKEFTAKRGTKQYSDPFIANNCKWRLSIWIKPDGEIGLCCIVMRGDHDDEVHWPIQSTVTLNIVNQDTLSAHKTGKYQKAFQRPERDADERWIGSLSFIKFSSIVDNPSIIVNDSIVVSSSVIN